MAITSPALSPAPVRRRRGGHRKLCEQAAVTVTLVKAQRGAHLPQAVSAQVRAYAARQGIPLSRVFEAAAAYGLRTFSRAPHPDTETLPTTHRVLHNFTLSQHLDKQVLAYCQATGMPFSYFMATAAEAYLRSRGQLVAGGGSDGEETRPTASAG